MSSNKPAPKSSPLNEQIPNIINPALAYILDNTHGFPPLNASYLTLPARIHNGHLQFTGGDLNAFIHSVGNAGKHTAKGLVKGMAGKIFGNVIAGVGKHFGVDTTSHNIENMKDLIDKGVDQSGSNPTTTHTYSDKGPFNTNSVYNI